MAIFAQLVDSVVAHKFEIVSGRLSIGRLPSNDVIIDDSSVSSHHAAIVCLPNPDFPNTVEYFIEDMGSTNGTEVNGNRISEKHQLHHNDDVQIAFNQFKFIDEQSVNLAKISHIIK